MLPIFPSLIAQALSLTEPQVKATLELLEGGCTIPFISRYRKEATGNLDEVSVTAISDEYDRLTTLQKRKLTILHALEEQNVLTEALSAQIEACWEGAVLEDLYLPYKPKRRTRAMAAREKGLAPLAAFLMAEVASLDHRPATSDDISREATAYVDKEKGVESAEEALKGAADIIAEEVAESAEARAIVRHNYQYDACLSSKQVKAKGSQKTSEQAPPSEAEAQKYRDYFDYQCPLSRLASHRYLAIRRGEAEGFLRVTVTGDVPRILERLQRRYVRSRRSAASPLVTDAISDAFSRLLAPAMETEFLQTAKQHADEEAIRIFARNLEQLLMAAPLGQHRVLALDPGFRTGCKVVVLSAEGALLCHDVIFPHPPKSQFVAAMQKIEDLVSQYDIEAIAIGNGTASRETEEFARGLDCCMPREGREPVQVFVVSEDGASIYSASKVAREEFPNEDVTVRGAVSIGRRLIDPLSELVKIDPNSVGVGQYQKDVDQKALRKSLDQTVESCVSRVGVNVNTASRHLLTYVAGVGPLLAQNIVDYRTAHGAFRSRRELLHVPRMGAKAFEQTAGFLRITGGSEPLDATAVHPESYPVVTQMATQLHCTVSDLLGEQGRDKRSQLNLSALVTDKVGMPTLQDIMAELDKPGRDPRQHIETFAFSSEVKTINDLQEGMVLPGIVTNLTKFGAFVDIGVHTSGLIHVSEIADRRVSDPASVLSLHQHLKVRVKEVDLVRGRIALSLKNIS